MTTAPSNVLEVEPDAVTDEMTIIDVREPWETASGHIPGALLVPLGDLPELVVDHVPDHTTPILLYCARGARSRNGGTQLTRDGYSNVMSLTGGYERWLSEDHRVEGEAQTPQRYQRQLVLPEVGPKGQERLAAASVAIIGAGGLGSPAALYLAGAGIGHLTIIDDDVVDESNLQRQILHDTPGVGQEKTVSTKRRLEALNPDVEVVTRNERLRAFNAVKLLADHDVIVDGADNFPTRYLVNDASLHLGTPVVHGSVYRFEGQVGVFHADAGPCYRCLFPAPPPPELAPNCVEGGVIGALPGVIGSLQAMETMKLILGIGEPLLGRLQIHDTLSAHVTTIAIPKDPDCSSCGRSEPPELIDYTETCLRP